MNSKNLLVKFMNESHKWLLRKPGLCLIFTVAVRVAPRPPPTEGLLQSVEMADLGPGQHEIC